MSCYFMYLISLAIKSCGYRARIVSAPRACTGDFFLSPFKKGACCFAPVGGSVGRSVDQAMFAQHL